MKSDRNEEERTERQKLNITMPASGEKNKKGGPALNDQGGKKK